MEMIVPILLAVAALVAVLDASTEECHEHATNEREPSRTHSGVIDAQYEELEAAGWMMSSKDDDVMVLEIGYRGGISSSSCVTGDAGCRKAEHLHRCIVNPANGLPMTGESEFGLDILGNPYGTDFQRDQSGYVHANGFGGVDSFGSSSGYLGSLGGSDDWS